MVIKLEIPSCNNDSGLKSNWEDGFEIGVKESNGQILISANKAGLVSLAIQLLTLAQDTIPVGCHFHFGDYNCLEKGFKRINYSKNQ
jgi:hypothetical protein